MRDAVGHRARATSVAEVIVGMRTPRGEFHVGVRSLCIAIDQWDSYVMDKGSRQPLVVVEANRVRSLNPAATAAGVRVGMKRRDAQAVCPSVLLRTHDPDESARSFETVLGIVDEYVPRVEVVEAGCCLFPTIGPARYHGGEEALVGLIWSRLVELFEDRSEHSPVVGLAIADGPRVAVIAARESIRDQKASGPKSLGPKDASRGGTGQDEAGQDGVGPLIVARGGTREFLSPLPIAHLSAVMGEETAGLLRRLGIKTIGAFADLAAEDVQARFGVDALDAHRMANGDDRVLLRLSENQSPPRSTRTVEPPLERVDQVAFIAKAMADDLVGGISSRGLVADKVLIAIETERGDRIERVWRTDRNFSTAAITQRLRWQLEGWLSTGRSRGLHHGGVSFLMIQPEDLRVHTGEQLGFWGGFDRRDRMVVNGMARIQGLFGIDSVRVPRPHGGRSPRDAYRLVNIDPEELLLASEGTGHGDDRGGERKRRGRGDSPEGGGQLAGPWPGSIPAPSPSRVWPEPVPAEVMDESGKVVQVSGRGVISAAPAYVSISGAPMRMVQAWAGPWCIEERWWDPARHRRKARVQVLIRPAGASPDGAGEDAEGHPSRLSAHLLTLEAGQWWVEASYD